MLHTLNYLEKHGYEVTYLPVDEFGKISLTELESAIRPDTILITVMMANNEVGTIEPIREIGEIAKAHNIAFHTDAVQAVGSIPVNVGDLKVDMLSLSAHKFGGPKGVGALYIKNGLRPEIFMHGGAQERARRAGTENVASIVGLGKAITLATTNLSAKIEKISSLRDYLIESIMKEIPHVKLNGHPEDRLPGNANFSSISLKVNLSFDAGFKRHCSIFRFCMYQRFVRPVSCAFGDGFEARNCSRLFAPFHWRNEHKRRD